MAKTLKPNGKGRSAEPKPNSITKEQFLELASRVENLQGETRDVSSSLGNVMKEVEERGINKVALKRALADKRLDAAKQRDRIDSYNAYCDWLGVGAQGEMFPASERGADPVLDA